MLMVSVCIGQPLPEDKDPGRLLLLCVGAAGAALGPCTLHCRDGLGHDRRHRVSTILFIIPLSSEIQSPINTVIDYFTKKSLISFTSYNNFLSLFYCCLFDSFYFTLHVFIGLGPELINKVK